MIRSYLSDNKVLSSKGQKLIAAIYLVTGHLPEHDPLKLKLRDLAVSLVEASQGELQGLSNKITSLLEAGVVARLVSESNVRIIETELRLLTDPSFYSDPTIATLFPVSPDKGQFLTKRTSFNSLSFINKSDENHVSDRKLISKENKSKRHEKILSYINERKSANIKDISSLFPDISEKTIQRELGLMAMNGQIVRRGNKRWSLYLSVSSK